MRCSSLGRCFLALSRRTCAATKLIEAHCISAMLSRVRWNTTLVPWPMAPAPASGPALAGFFPQDGSWALGPRVAAIA